MPALGMPSAPPPAVVLQDYDRHGRIWSLEIATGLLTPASGRCHGFVRVLDEPARGGPPVPAALYAEGSGARTLWLQYGPERWDCSTVAVRQASEPDGHRLFTVFGERGPELELRYPAPDPGPFDPAYDWIDTVADDFFLWAAERLTDPTEDTTDARRALTAHFATGFLSA
ncbi:hypothetical protein [Streptomyces flavofungini]|uniref:Uncharacterized protein n=1 Tax=Streptomyces flavofungini TaxID=68200 RepID=A0ABS0XA96_9ACTN|nr:hypothetical protein [Streptomyces flavofungini]MBJ3809961.1 hypothetical protein [Streptomyces flavofungini]GHC53788.1 hypothetical protein GCM10010349_20030 [Streptomyces flavofungini]